MRPVAVEATDGGAPALADILEQRPDPALYHTPARTQALVDRVNPDALEAIRQAAKNRGADGRTIVIGTHSGRGITLHPSAKAAPPLTGRQPWSGPVVFEIDAYGLRTRKLSVLELNRLNSRPDGHQIPAGGYRRVYESNAEGIVRPLFKAALTQFVLPVLEAHRERQAAATLQHLHEASAGLPHLADIPLLSRRELEQYRVQDAFAPVRCATLFSGCGDDLAGFRQGRLPVQCDLSLDNSRHKAKLHRMRHPREPFVEMDIREFRPTVALPHRLDFLWASSPCTSFSLAGKKDGLASESGRLTWEVSRVVRDLARSGLPPKVVAVENVDELLNLKHGVFPGLCRDYTALGYRCAAVVMDARDFVPQSRVRVFLVFIHKGVVLPEGVVGAPDPKWHPRKLLRAVDALPAELQENFLWLQMPHPVGPIPHLADYLDPEPPAECWFGQERTDDIIAKMRPAHRRRLDGLIEESLQRGARISVPLARRRKERGPELGKWGAARARCITGAGGRSSKQTLVVVENGTVRIRDFSVAELSRLMGRETVLDGLAWGHLYRAASEGLAVPVVAHFFRSIVEPIILADRLKTKSCRATARSTPARREAS